MNNFVLLHCNGDEIWVNLAHVVKITTDEGRAILWFDVPYSMNGTYGMQHIKVDESANYVAPI